MKQCNEFAIANNMKELCEIYDVFGLEQDAMIIYHSIVEQLVQEKQHVEEVEVEIKIKRKGN